MKFNRCEAAKVGLVCLARLKLDAVEQAARTTLQIVMQSTTIKEASQALFFDAHPRHGALNRLQCLDLFGCAPRSPFTGLVGHDD